ncbi:hypothetical protein D9M68_820780 [compost metagenome]
MAVAKDGQLLAQRACGGRRQCRELQQQAEERHQTEQGDQPQRSLPAELLGDQQAERHAQYHATGHAAHDDGDGLASTLRARHGGRGTNAHGQVDTGTDAGDGAPGHQRGEALGQRTGSVGDDEKAQGQQQAGTLAMCRG